MRPRVLILPISAAVILALVGWKMQWESTHRQRRPVSAPRETGAAPAFFLNDQNGVAAKFERYLGRTRVLLLFTGEAESLEQHALLTALADSGGTLASQGIQVITVTPATPFAIRNAEKRRGKPYPFPVLTDINPKQPIPAPVHQLWGRYDNAKQRSLSGLFLIGRTGQTTMHQGTPLPEADPGGALRKIASGEWPGP